jgi:hypothetical protein
LGNQPQDLICECLRSGLASVLRCVLSVFMTELILTPPDQDRIDRIVFMRELRQRWGVADIITIRRRAERLGVPIIRFNKRVLGVRLRDLLKAESQATLK